MYDSFAAHDNLTASDSFVFDDKFLNKTHSSVDEIYLEMIHSLTDENIHDSDSIHTPEKFGVIIHSQIVINLLR